jgi:hypothetical protein
MAPQYESYGRCQQQKEADSKEFEYPGLENEDYAQQDATDKQYLYRTIGFLRDIVIQPAGYVPDYGHEGEYDGSEYQDKWDGSKHDILSQLLIGRIIADNRHGYEAKDQCYHGRDR